MVTIALPVNEGVGHVVVVIGFDPTTNELIFYNPALGVKQPESELVKMYGSSRGINTFADLWAASNQFIPSNAMVTVQKVDPQIPILGGDGGGAHSSNFPSLYLR